MCRVRKSQGKAFGSCKVEELGETRQSIYFWCVDCGALIKEPLEFGKRKLFIPLFDPQSSGPS